MTIPTIPYLTSLIDFIKVAAMLFVAKTLIQRLTRRGSRSYLSSSSSSSVLLQSRPASKLSAAALRKFSLASDSNISFSNSNSSSNGSTTNDSDTDSILAYVSTLFQDEDESEQSSDYDTGDRRAATDGLIARIVPVDQIEYEHRKPVGRRCDAQALRKQLPDKLKEPVEEPRELTEDVAILLQVDATIPSPSKTGVRHILEMSMHRHSDEVAERSLQRMSLSLQRKLQQQERKLNKTSRQRHTKKNLETSTTDMETSIWIQSESTDGELNLPPKNNLDGYTMYPLLEETKGATLWNALLQQARPCKLCMRNTSNGSPLHCLPIIPCPPTILSVNTFEDFEAQVFVGVPLVVQVQVLHATRAIVVWFADGVEVAHDSPVYIPTTDDIGKALSVLIIPVRPGHSGAGYEEAYEFGQPVEPLPELPLVSPLRDAWTIERGESTDLRVLSYNLLADMYTARAFDQQVMYNHCDPQFLFRRRRMPLLVYEILAYHPDIVCLQEVDTAVFTGLLKPCLESQGYQGYYSNKASAQLEGCAMFWSLRCFERADASAMQDYCLRDLFQKIHERHQLDRWDSLSDIDRLLRESPELCRVTREKVGQVMQVAELRLRSPQDGEQPERMVVGNTHLFYHPLADHIRAMQAYMVCRQMDIARRRKGTACPLLLCGDMNSDPLSGAVHLLLERKVGPEHRETWKNLHNYEWGMGDEEFLLEHGYIGNAVDSGDPLYKDEAFEDAVEYLNPEEDLTDSMLGQPPQIGLPTTFPMLRSGYTEMPLFTNYAIDFSETLDYILASESSTAEPYGLAPNRSAPMPEIEMMEQYGAMPNEFMPSDHVSLVCDLQWERFDASKSP